jgi:hypothetical protein
MDDLRLNAIPTLDPKRSTYSALGSVTFRNVDRAT